MSRQSDMEDHVFEDPHTLQRQRLLNPRSTGISRSTRLSPMKLRNAVINEYLKSLREQLNAAKRRRRPANKCGTARRRARRPAGGTKRRTGRRTKRRPAGGTKCRR